MRKKVLALGLALVMCMPMTALARSSTTTNNSSNQSQSSQSQSSQSQTPKPAQETPKPVDEVVASTPAGGSVKEENVILVIPAEDGTAATTTLEVVVESKQDEVKAVVEAVATVASTAQIAATAQVTATVNRLLTAAPSPQFTATVVALARIKGGDMVVNNMGSVKTAAIAEDAYGNTIAAAGKVENVTSGALIMLMSINEDGRIEYVEGVVDPANGMVVGAFQGKPVIITVFVLA